MTREEIEAIYSPPSTATTTTTAKTVQIPTPVEVSAIGSEKLKNDLLDLQRTIQKLKQQINVQYKYNI